jgi:hypothetical protein
MDAPTKIVLAALQGRIGMFRPCAYFEDRLDCIRVITKDCRVLEERLNARITIHWNLQPAASQRECVGFTFKGALHFCERHSLDITRPIEIGAFLDAIARTEQETAARAFVELVARPLVHDGQIETIDINPTETFSSV